MFALGLDIGSSSIKAALVDLSDNTALAVVKSPEEEMIIDVPQLNWAEQDPNDWWLHVCLATKKLLSEIQIDPNEIKSIGISYQMHGLVAVDKNQNVVRPSIIWCDSRAVDIGNQALLDLGEEFCLSHYLNSPGNFTASKLAWVQQNEPQVYEKIDKIMLPGDFIAMKITGEINSTICGLTEGIMWDFKEQRIANELLDYYKIDSSLIPNLCNNLEAQGYLQAHSAKEMGLTPGIPITYRAGDQPNNALSLGVIRPGQVAAAGGTSGVVYGVSDQPLYDPESRVNGFAHINHTNEENSIGVLLCLNGAGSQHRYIRTLIGDSVSYDEMEKEASKISIGSDGLQVYPFGNGAERMLKNKNAGANYANINFNTHHKAHFYRASLEGIAFSFAYGMEIMKSMGIPMNQMKAGNDNLFQSTIFSQTLANVAEIEIDLIQTTGAIGAAQASACGTGHFSSIQEAVSNIESLHTFEPDFSSKKHKNVYESWKNAQNGV